MRARRYYSPGIARPITSAKRHNAWRCCARAPRKRDCRLSMSIAREDRMSWCLTAPLAFSMRMPKFGAGVALVDIDGAAPDFSIRGPIAPAIPIEAEVYAALMLGVRDYVD